MTDNEIIKALECCQTEYNRNCEECPYEKFRMHCISAVTCSSRLREDLLYFINRQKAEIEELEAEIDKQYEQAKADILGNMAGGGTSCHWCIDQHRANAGKKFAEGLHKYINEFRERREMVMLPYTEAALLAIERKIDNLVKEFTEGGDTE